MGGNGRVVYGLHNINSTVSAPDEWEVKIETIHECGKLPKDIKVKITQLVKDKIDALMNKYRSREWLAYLVGDNFTVTDLIIPVQVATAASVDNIEFPETDQKIIGVIHSHHNMGIGFSGTDETWINQNHDISILVSHTKIMARVRQVTPCGARKLSDVEVVVIPHKNKEVEDWLERETAKIKEPYTRSYNYGRYWKDGNWHYYDDADFAGFFGHGSDGKESTAGHQSRKETAGEVDTEKTLREELIAMRINCN